MVPFAMLMLLGAPKAKLYPDVLLCERRNMTTEDCTLLSDDGNEFVYTIADGCKGDVYAVIFNDNGTPEDRTDDIIVECRYCYFNVKGE